MRVGLTVIGEVGGRWESPVAEQDERVDTPATIEELVAHGWQFVAFRGMTFPVTIEWLRKKGEYDPLAHVRKREWLDRLMPPSFIKLTCSVEYSEQYVKDYLKPGPHGGPEISTDEVETIIANSAVDDVSGLFLEIVLAANIARLGSLRIHRVFRFINDVCVGTGNAVGRYMSEELEEATRRGWPSFHPLTLPQVVRWLNQIPGFKQRHAETKLGRAVAAASQLLTQNHAKPSLDIVWALLGLEALYTRTNVGLQQQLMDKTETFLGPRTTNKKEFGNMYDFRSRFLHGDVNLLYAHNRYDASDRYAEFSSALAASENVAVALLFATLQRMCAENRFELVFRYALDPASKQ